MTYLSMLIITTLASAGVMSSHPIALASIILAQTLVISVSSAIALRSPWFPLILFMIFLGGVMVLFMYTTSLAANENFSWTSWDSLISSILGVPILTLLILSNEPYPTSLSMKLETPPISMYSPHMVPVTLILMIYLLVALIIIAEIIKIFKAPMRSLF